MNANIERESLDDTFRRVSDLDVSLREQLRTFAETVRRDRPEFAAAVDRLVTRFRRAEGMGALARPPAVPTRPPHIDEASSRADPPQRQIPVDRALPSQQRCEAARAKIRPDRARA